MTLTPALLRLAGPWVFWPWRLRVRQQEGHDADRRQADWHSGPSSPFQSLWQAMGGVLQRWPGTIWLATVLVLSPFAGLAVINYDNVNYGPIQDLPSSAPSVSGTQDSYQTFSRGVRGAAYPRCFATTESISPKRTVSSRSGSWLISSSGAGSDLKLADLRSVADPLGISRAAREALSRAWYPLPAHPADRAGAGHRALREQHQRVGPPLDPDGSRPGPRSVHATQHQSPGRARGRDPPRASPRGSGTAPSSTSRARPRVSAISRRWASRIESGSISW